MYQIYLSESTSPFVKEKTFYEYFKKFFGPDRIDKSEPQVRISKYSSHSVCDQCVALSQARKGAKSQEQLEAINHSKKIHMKKIGEARTKMEELKQHAIQFPEDSLVFQIDGMDNSKSYCPRFLDKSKKTVGMLRLPTKITGCNIYSGLYGGNRKCIFYLNHDHYENASNLVISVIFKLINVFLNDHGRLPRHLKIFSDNCWRENKNRYVFSFLAELVDLGIFESASMDFLCVGHTGNEVDQVRSTRRFACLHHREPLYQNR